MNKTATRKLDHLKICTRETVESNTSDFQNIKIVHKATPEIDKRDIDLSISFLGRRFQMPFMIASMTGGHPGTMKVNESLAKAAEELQIGIGVGSQRAALEDPEQEDSFRVMRDNAPDIFIYGNIGAAQLKEYGVEGVEKAVEMIDANAIAIHLNFLQEAIQPEGEANGRGVINSIKELSSSIKVPVIVKETGAGISYSVAEDLAKAGVSAIDVGGVGGTSWAGVEVYRAIAEGDKLLEDMGKLFWDWGLPTPVCIAECASVGIPIIASGGIRTGLDIAKSIALGADLCSAALPFTKPALNGPHEVIELLERMREELKVAMFLSGSINVEELKKAQIVLLGKTREMIVQRGRMKII
ncbi:MAG: type 2 isopentenyl-diphosphate Delta-isomerase [Halobacteriota archaeon]|nr:type 2 isopentenyl-diphosphate Delta-isomerase [Halobacteriota archaeon]